MHSHVYYANPGFPQTIYPIIKDKASKCWETYLVGWYFKTIIANYDESSLPYMGIMSIHSKTLSSYTGVLFLVSPSPIHPWTRLLSSQLFYGDYKTHKRLLIQGNMSVHTSPHTYISTCASAGSSHQCFQYGKAKLSKHTRTSVSAQRRK